MMIIMMTVMIVETKYLYPLHANQPTHQPTSQHANPANLPPWPPAYLLPAARGEGGVGELLLT